MTDGLEGTGIDTHAGDGAREVQVQLLSPTPRRVLAAVAIALAVVLVALIVLLLWFLGRPQNLTSMEPVQGVQAVWQVYGPGTGDNPLFGRPMGIAVNARGRIYVTDATNNRVCVFDSRGRFLFEFGGFGIAKPATGGTVTYEPGLLNYPVGIDIDADGNVYVASFYNDSIEVFEADGTPIRRIPDPTVQTGRGGSGAGGTGIAVTDVAVFGDRVYATDAYQVFVFSRNGDVLDQWGQPGSPEHDLDHPNGIAVSKDGTVYVSDSNHNRLVAYSPEGEFLWQVGAASGGIADQAVHDLELPRGLTLMSDGSILVCDAFGFQLVRISPEGEVLARYGERGVEPAQFNFTNDVEALRDSFAIADRANGRVQLVRLLD